MFDVLTYLAPAAIITGALLAGLNLGARLTGLGFIAFTVGSLAWMGIGLREGDGALLWQNLVLVALNAFGAWRWLGREAVHEKGAKVAQQHSERQRDGPDLFAASLLTRAPVQFADEDGRAVDAMLACGDGRPAYLVAATGGVGGVGERLHRVPWAEVGVDGEKLTVAGQADAYREMEHGEWPGR